MQNSNARWVYSGIATAATVALVALLVFDVNLNQTPPLPEYSDVTPVDPAPVSKRKISSREGTIAAQPNDTLPVQVTEAVQRLNEFESDESTARDTPAERFRRQEPSPQIVNNRREELVDHAKTAGESATPLSVAPDQPVPVQAEQRMQATLGKGVRSAIRSDELHRAEFALLPPVQQPTEVQFEAIEPSTIKLTTEAPVSTFSIDVDTASYSYVRKLLSQGRLPNKDMVRLEELVNYFPYAYPLPPSKEEPFALHTNLIDAPWHNGNQLLHIGIKGYEAPRQRGVANLVFLIDVSGSMRADDKLPLIKCASSPSSAPPWPRASSTRQPSTRPRSKCNNSNPTPHKSHQTRSMSSRNR